MAKKQNKKIVSLDTQKELDRLRKQNPTPPCDIRNILKITPSLCKSYQLETIAEYHSGAVIVEDQDPITIGRNHFWLPTISPHLSNGGAFIAVGFYHLYGSHGLLQLLQ